MSLWSELSLLELKSYLKYIVLAGCRLSMIYLGVFSYIFPEFLWEFLLQCYFSSGFFPRSRQYLVALSICFICNFNLQKKQVLFMYFFYVLETGNLHVLILNYSGGKDVISMIIFFSKIQKKPKKQSICDSGSKSYRCRLLIFKCTLHIIKLMLPILFKYRKYGTQQSFIRIPSTVSSS